MRGRDLAEEWDRYWGTPDPDRRDRKWALYARLLEIVSDLQKEKPRMRAIDVGCGRGLLLDRLSVLQGVNAIGVDFSSAAVAICTADERGLVVLKGDAHQVPVSGGPVDLILSTDTLNHLEDPAAALASWRGAIGADGHMLIAVADPTIGQQDGPEPPHAWTDDELLELFADADLTVHDLEHVAAGEQSFRLVIARA